MTQFTNLNIEKNLQYMFTTNKIRAYSRKQGHACGITKTGQERSIKWHSYELFPLNVSNLGDLESDPPLPTGHEVLKVSPENKLFHFIKRALRSGTSSNKWLNEAMKMLVIHK